MGDVGEGARLDFAVIPVGLTEEDGGRGVAIGHGGDVHTYTLSKILLDGYVLDSGSQRFRKVGRSERDLPGLIEFTG